MAAGAVSAGALVVALVVGGGVGAGAQPGPATRADPATVAAATPTAGAAIGETPSAQPTKQRAKEKAKQKATKVRIPERGSGTFHRAQLDGPKAGAKRARLLRYDVRVEKDLPYDADEVAREIQMTLTDSRSWIGGGDWRLELVSDPDRADFTVFLATPGTVDRYCWPLRTYGRVSCQAGNRVMLNAWRWAHGADAYQHDLVGYRQYLVNHEVGHRLGHQHMGCPAKGKRAPVMMQQTKGVGSCRANPWPAPERRG